MKTPFRYFMATIVAIVLFVPTHVNAEDNKPTKPKKPERLTLVVKPLPIKKTFLSISNKFLSDSADKIISFVTPTQNFKSKTIVEKYIPPVQVNWVDEKEGGVDCIRYDIKASKTEVHIGEEFEININLSFVDQLPLAWRAEGCNKFTLQLARPEGFVQTGGNYEDFMPITLDEQNKGILVTLKGVMLKNTDSEQFMVLKGPVGADENTIFVKKEVLELRFIGGTQKSVVSKLNENSVIQETIKINGENSDKVMADCGVDPLNTSAYPSYFLAGQRVNLSAYSYPNQCSGNIVWSDNLGNTFPTGAYISTFPTQTTTYTATCTQNGCTSNPSTPLTATLTNDCNLVYITTSSIVALPDTSPSCYSSIGKPTLGTWK